MNDIKNMTTSQLIMKYINPVFRNNNDEIEATLSYRLKTKYNLMSKDSQKIIIENDKRVFNLRGENMDNYIFSPNNNLDDILNIFYQNTKMIVPFYLMTENDYNNFTISELAIMYNVFMQLYMHYKNNRNIAASNELLCEHYHLLEKCMFVKFSELFKSMNGYDKFRDREYRSIMLEDSKPFLENKNYKDTINNRTGAEDLFSIIKNDVKVKGLYF